MNLLDELFRDPYLPEAGEVYWISTQILDGMDPKPRRPGVVVRVPPTLAGRIVVVTRTKNILARGVTHAADPELGLSSAGVFAHIRTAEAELWHRPNVEWMGSLDKEIFKLVVEEFLG